MFHLLCIIKFNFKSGTALLDRLACHESLARHQYRNYKHWLPFVYLYRLNPVDFTVFN